MLFRSKKVMGMLCILITGLLAGMLSGCGNSAKTITVGSKNFTENIILGEIFTQLLEAKTDLKVIYKENLGGTMVNFEALKKGDLDIYPEYTGTALTAELKMDVINDADKVYDTVKKEFEKKYKIKWLEPLGFNNTYAIAVNKDFAERNHINKVSDLVPVSSDLIFGAEHEFFDRQDGYSAMTKTYGLTFRGEPVKMDTSLKYQAMGERKMDVTDAFSTDGQLITYNLKVLEDDKKFFPPYYAAPIVRMDTLKKHPEIEQVLSELAGKISDAEMQKMNYRADSEKISVERIAKEFLQEKGLIK